MGTRSILVMVTLSGVLVVACTDYGYYAEEDDAAAAVTVAPVSEEPAEKEEAETASAAGAAAGVALEPAIAFDAKDFLKAMPPSPRPGADGLERHRDWKSLPWDNPCATSVWKRSESSDDVVLVVDLKGGPSDKAVTSRQVNLAFAESGTLRMDVYNAASRSIPVAFAVFSSVDRVYSETKAQTAPSGWSHLEFDLGASTYKTAASEWKHTARLWGPEDIRELVMLFYDGGAAQLALDRLEVDAAPPASRPAEQSGPPPAGLPAEQSGPPPAGGPTEQSGPPPAGLPAEQSGPPPAGLPAEQSGPAPAQ